MNIGRACAIFAQINRDKYTDDEKAMAIYAVLNMATHNSVTKDNMLVVIKWLFDRLWSVGEDKGDE